MNFLQRIRQKKISIACWLLLIAYCSLNSSCKKESFITSPDARFRTSVDSVKFDTVFTTTGSITQSFKIFNDNNQKLRISKIKLMGGISSFYKMNVDGSPATEVNNFEIAANDSAYIFITVTINPNATNLPFIVKDSILFNYNGNTRFVQLEAFGQNAVFLRNQVITGNVVWTKTLPYVIVGSLRVDTTATLTIQQGTRVYLHADAPFLVDGTLIANGVKTDSITFTGDRLDAGYKDLPASWPGIYFRGKSKDNVCKYAIVKNAYQAIVVQSPSINANPKLIMRQCIIDNAYDAGVLCVNTSMQMDNSLISNCGANIAIAYGGDYNFTHCTASSFSNNYISHKNAVLQVNNYALQGGTIVTNNLNAIFRNSIFWGEPGFVDNEVVVTKQGSNTFNVLFDRCLYRAATDPANATLTSVIKNQNPLFDSIDVVKNIYNFRITNAAAPGVNKGILTAFVKDLDDKNRNNGLPDLGCYEKQ